jgi:hypothetical protein
VLGKEEMTVRSDVVSHDPVDEMNVPATRDPVKTSFAARPPPTFGTTCFAVQAAPTAIILYSNAPCGQVTFNVGGVDSSKNDMFAELFSYVL